jgi:hypothetical protein
MGLFGDKDLKTIDMKLMEIKVDVGLFQKELISNEKLNQEVTASVNTIVASVKRLDAKGKGDKARARIAGVADTDDEVQQHLEQLKALIETQIA